MAAFTQSKLSHPDFATPDKLPSARDVSAESDGIAKGMWDCRLYSHRDPVNLVDGVVDQVDTTSIIEEGMQGQDFPGSSAINLGSAHQFGAYTKYAIVTADTLITTNMISGSATNEHAFWFDGNEIRAGHNGSYNTVGFSASAQTIYHTCVTYDGDRIALFVDGLLVASATSLAVPSTGGDS